MHLLSAFCFSCQCSVFSLLLHGTSKDSEKVALFLLGQNSKCIIGPPLVLETACQVPFPCSFVFLEKTLVVAENFHVHGVHSVHIIASRSQLIVAHNGLLGLIEGRQLL